MYHPVNSSRQGHCVLLVKTFYCRAATAACGFWSSQLCRAAMQQLLFDKLGDRVEYLVQSHVAGIENDCVEGGHERRSCASGIPPITLSHLLCDIS